MDPHGADSTELVNNSVLHKEFLAEREEILCHKWIESEKAGYDIGFERALLIQEAIRSSVRCSTTFPRTAKPGPSRMPICSGRMGSSHLFYLRSHAPVLSICH